MPQRSSLRSTPDGGGPVERARADLSYIRHALEEAGTFTAISGAGVAWAGAIGLAASVTSALYPVGRGSGWTPGYTSYFLAVWTVALLLAVPAASYSLYRKARHWNLPLSTGPTRRALRSMAPGWLAAALVTGALLWHGLARLLPGMWLLLDGLALLGAATFSIAQVRWMGRSLAILGILATFFSSPLFALVCLGAGFGLLHLIMGLHIARHYDG